MARRGSRGRIRPPDAAAPPAVPETPYENAVYQASIASNLIRQVVADSRSAQQPQPDPHIAAAVRLFGHQGIVLDSLAGHPGSQPTQLHFTPTDEQRRVLEQVIMQSAAIPAATLRGSVERMHTQTVSTMRQRYNRSDSEVAPAVVPPPQTPAETSDWSIQGDLYVVRSASNGATGSRALIVNVADQLLEIAAQVCGSVVTGTLVTAELWTRLRLAFQAVPMRMRYELASISSRLVWYALEPLRTPEVAGLGTLNVPMFSRPSVSRDMHFGVQHGDAGPRDDNAALARGMEDSLAGVTCRVLAATAEWAIHHREHVILAADLGVGEGPHRFHLRAEDGEAGFLVQTVLDRLREVFNSRPVLEYLGRRIRALIQPHADPWPTIQMPACLRQHPDRVAPRTVLSGRSSAIMGTEPDRDGNVFLTNYEASRTRTYSEVSKAFRVAVLDRIIVDVPQVHGDTAFKERVGRMASAIFELLRFGERSESDRVSARDFEAVNRVAELIMWAAGLKLPPPPTAEPQRRLMQIGG